MSSLILGPQKLFGLLELDLQGRVIFSKLEGEEKLATAADLVGRNFFSEVATFSSPSNLEKITLPCKSSSTNPKSFCGPRIKLLMRSLASQLCLHKDTGSPGSRDRPVKRA